MIELLVILIFAYGIFASFAWLRAHKRNALYWSDICPPLVLPLLWVVITSSGYEHQSLSHLIEVPIVLIISVLLLYLRIFVLDAPQRNSKMNSYLTLGFSIILVVLIRTFMPYLPE